MPDYTNLPTDWKNAIEKVAGLSLSLEFVLDPENRNVILSGRYGIDSCTQIITERELSVNYERRPILKDVSVSLKDPDGFLNPYNSKSPFYNVQVELYESVHYSETLIKIKKIKGVEFHAGQTIKVTGPDYEEGSSIGTVQVTVNSFTTGATFDTIELTGRVGRSFALGSLVYMNTFRETIQIQLVSDSTANPLILYRGVMMKSPESVDEQLLVTIGDYKIELLNKELTGADTDSTKLMIPNESGTLIDSSYWNDEINPTFDISEVYPKSGCKLGQWSATFNGTTDYTLKGPGETGRSCNRLLGLIGRSEVDALDSVFYQYIKDNRYIYLAGTNSRDLVILDVDDPENVICRSETSYSDEFVFYSSVTKKDNYVFIVHDYPVGSDVVGAIQCILVGNVLTPSYAGSIVAGQNGVPDDAFFYTAIVNGNYLYATGHDYVYIFNISDPYNITYVTRIGGQEYPYYMIQCYESVIDGDYLYTVSPTYKKLVIFDINTTPTAPTLVTVFDLPVGCVNIRILGDYAYMKGGKGESTLVIANISDPSNPVIANTFVYDGKPYFLGGYGLDIDGSFLFSINGYDGAITIFDIGTDPENPVHYETIYSPACPPDYVGSYNMWLVVESGYIYYPGSSGFNVYKYSTEKFSTQGEQLTITPAAWGGSIGGGDVITFTTGVSWENENPVNILYDLLVNYAGIPKKSINGSSYFGEKTIGTLRGALVPGATVVTIDVQIPVFLKNGHSLSINGTSVTVSGMDIQNSYPPFITLNLASAYSGTTKAAGSNVIWEQISSPDLDYNFDAEYLYCENNSIAISITMEREITVLEAIETIGGHFDAFTYPDSWGRENVFSFRERSETPIEIDSDSGLLIPDPYFKNYEMVNDINLFWGLDFLTGEYLNNKTFEGTDRKNKSYWRTGILISGELYLPGIYSESLADYVAGIKFNIHRDGIRGVVFNTDLRGYSLQIGDKIKIKSDSPEFELLTTITSKSIIFDNGVYFEFEALDIPETTWS